MTNAVKMNAPDVLEISPAKERILKEAIDLFYEKGFERTTVRDIAARAGILSGSLFHHFKSKQEILYTAMALTTRTMGESAEKAVEGITDPARQLRALILNELNSIHRETGHAAYVLVDEWRSLDDTYKEAVLAIRDNSYEACWDAALEGCAAKGLLKGDLRVTRQLIRGSLAWTRNWYQTDGKMTLAALADEVLATFLSR
ncbi:MULTISPECIES: TetR/AcrR family transcriptional regulator [Kordiimonas]|jgi:AcrR family transcriptional regulator|uniref:TetR/AcrR family transcriptional regulator n=1 Tax=Kordiimonas TaxID=288021 RepID=UPI00257B3D33|nr:TetR/AcrR family transcriptional regulator [Kordiimonas sp. UBA4487]